MPGDRGATLLELLVGTAVAAASAAALIALLIGGVSALARVDRRAAALADLERALDQIVRDVRLAGYDPRGAGVAGLEVATRTRLVVTADLDGDGTIDRRSAERVAYQRAGGGAALLRIVGRQRMAILSDLTPDGLRLRYADAAGAAVDPDDRGARAAIRFVEVVLAVRMGDATVRLAGGARLVNGGAS